MPEQNIHPTAFIHEAATVAGFVHLGEKSSVWPAAVVRADLNEIKIAKGVNIQDGAVLHTDMNPPLSIGDYSLIGHKAMLHGCTVGKACLIGIDSTILDGAQIGDGAMIAAGCLVRGGTKIEPFSLVVPGAKGGVKIFKNKAKTLRTIAGSLEYIRLAEMHRSGNFSLMTSEDETELRGRAKELYQELFGFSQ